MAISMSEILKGKNLADQSPEIQANLEILLERINKVRTAYAKSMSVTSGLRTMEDHLRIYKAKGITDTSKIPMKSKHLYGQAVDIADPNGLLMDWCVANEDILEKIGLWCEERDNIHRVHFQTVPPKSGKRFFKP